MKAIFTLLMLVAANVFMTFAWYGHLRFTGGKQISLFLIILLSWGIAFFEYCLQIPANKVGYVGNGGPFTLIELKVLQEVITLSVFVVFSMVFFKNEVLKWNHFVGFGCLVMAVYFIFRK